VRTHVKLLHTSRDWLRHQGAFAEQYRLLASAASVWSHLNGLRLDVFAAGQHDGVLGAARQHDAARHV
jgi:hypothetical protein